ncbi:MAG: signal peptidase II [Chloroherpetonaceae bacterium]|nr:signal peptidase II [Chloroherpetonaceae bacterium]
MQQMILIALFLIGLDQVTKYLAKVYMFEKGIFQIPLLGDWFKFTYVENPGIAFGVELPGGRITISIFSIIAVAAITWYIFHSFKNTWPYKFSFSFVIGGAIGNLIDRVLYGRVIDFAHLDLYNGTIGGYYLSLWPVFNIADAAISIGVVSSLIFYKQIFEEQSLVHSTMGELEQLSNKETTQSPESNPQSPHE